MYTFRFVIPLFEPICIVLLKSQKTAIWYKKRDYKFNVYILTGWQTLYTSEFVICTKFLVHQFVIPSKCMWDNTNANFDSIFIWDTFRQDNKPANSTWSRKPMRLFFFQTPKNSVEWKMQSKIKHFGHIFLNVFA